MAWVPSVEEKVLHDLVCVSSNADLGMGRADAGLDGRGIIPGSNESGDERLRGFVCERIDDEDHILPGWYSLY